MRSIITILLLINLNLYLSGQGYHYVSDRDKFTFIRAEPDINSAVIDTVYIHRVMRTGESRNNWISVRDNKKELGWVHASRLRPMPSGSHERLKELIDIDHYENQAYIASIDLPHIVIYFNRIYGDYPHFDTSGLEKYSGIETSVIVTPGAEEVYVTDLLSRRDIMSWFAWIPVHRLILYSAGVFIIDEDAQFSFFKNKEGKGCISIAPIRSPSICSYPQSEIDTAIDRARRFRDQAMGKNHAEIRYLAFNYNDPDDYRLLECLHTAYYTGDQRAKELYPFVLRTMISDGAGTEEKYSYEYFLWVKENAGTTEFEKFQDPNY